MNTNEIPNKRKVFFMKLCAFLFCAVCFSLLAYDVSYGSYVMEGFDQAAFYGIRHLECSFSTVFFKLMSNMVHPIVIVLISFSMIHFLKQKRYLIALFGNLVLTLFLNMATKGAIMRVRPPEEWRLATEVGYSFPSGHSMMAASFYGFLIFMIWHSAMSGKQKKRGILLCLLTIFLVGSSRVYLGVHYATDVIAAFMVSTMYLLFYTLIVRKYLDAGLTMVSKNPLANQRLFMSFKYASDGILEGLRREKNMMIHYSALIMVVVFGLTLHLSKLEWSICLILCGLVIGMEQMNTALEAVVDLVTEDKKPLAKLAKDTAAGAVLVAAITSVVVGLLIFLPKILFLLNFNIK